MNNNIVNEYNNACLKPVDVKSSIYFDFGEEKRI